MRHQLSIPQIQILKYLALGMPRKEIADALKLSPKTVEFHIAGTTNPNSIQCVTGAIALADQVRWAVKHKLIDIDPKPMPNDPKPKAEPKKLKTTGDLAQALLEAASKAAAGEADVLQVNALCNCTDSLINLARMQIQANERLGVKDVPWLTNGESK